MRKAIFLIECRFSFTGNDILKKVLVDVVSQNQISPQDFEKLTGEEVETQADVNGFLINEIWKPLYGD